MRKAVAGACVAAAVLAMASDGSAQDAAAKPKYKIQPLNLRKEALGSEGFAAVARARMRNGDCAGALEAFDLAINSSIEGSIRRDRGLCHERLGNAYPAIDDFRYYLTTDPDAADADGIRGRLARLEQDTYGHSSAPAADTPDTAAPASPAPSTDAEDAPDHKRDVMETVEHDHDEISSPLRHGKGWAIAPFFAEHKWQYPGVPFGEGDTWSECVGLQLRWSVTRRGAFVLEGGFEQFNSGAYNISGLTSQLAYEVRFPLDPDFTDQLFLAPGLGFEYFTDSPRQAGASATSGGAFVPRVRFGYRHLVAAATALDFALDAGVTTGALAEGTFLTTAPNGGSPTAELIAFNFAFVWGL